MYYTADLKQHTANTVLHLRKIQYNNKAEFKRLLLIIEMLDFWVKSE